LLNEKEKEDKYRTFYFIMFELEYIISAKIY